jgi:hypothetical protein
MFGLKFNKYMNNELIYKLDKNKDIKLDKRMKPQHNKIDSIKVNIKNLNNNSHISINKNINNKKKDDITFHNLNNGIIFENNEENLSSFHSYDKKKKSNDISKCQSRSKSVDETILESIYIYLDENGNEILCSDNGKQMNDDVMLQTFTLQNSVNVYDKINSNKNDENLKNSEKIDEINKNLDEFKKTFDSKIRKLSDDIIEKIKDNPTFKKKKIKTKIIIPGINKLKNYNSDETLLNFLINELETKEQYIRTILDVNNKLAKDIIILNLKLSQKETYNSEFIHNLKKINNDIEFIKKNI